MHVWHCWKAFPFLYADLIDLIREQNELLIRALYEQFGSEILAQKLREIRNETDLQENADNEQDMKSEIPSILDRFTSQKVPEYDDCAENGETKMPIASCQGEQLLHNCRVEIISISWIPASISVDSG